MFTVTGFIDSVAYSATVGGIGPDEGVVSGTRTVMSLLRLHEGQEVLVTPTGPTVTVDLHDEKAVLGALHALTTVSEVVGDAPEVIPPVEPGAVY